MDHKIRYYSYRNGAMATATISDEGYQEMVKEYEEKKDLFTPDMEINCAEDYMRVILAFNY